MYVEEENWCGADDEDSHEEIREDEQPSHGKLSVYAVEVEDPIQVKTISLNSDTLSMVCNIQRMG